VSGPGRPLLFYAAWPLGYHNIEAERKAVSLAEDGYDVVYMTGIGTRNPRLSRLPKLVDRVGRKLSGGAAGVPAAVPGLRTAALAVVPPRQLGVVRCMNERWLERQLRATIGDWGQAVAWVRWPTQELVAALRQLRPELVVYESVDANHLSPGIIGTRWHQIFEEAERALVSLADVVVVPGEALAERYRAWGAAVTILPHGVDLGAWRQEREPVQAPTLGFIGTLDYRLDMAAIQHIATARPDWSLRLIGPVQEGFHPQALSAFRNVSVEAAVPPSEVAALNLGFDVGLLAYRDHPHYTFMAPLKALELLGAGTPVVARWNPALAELGGLVRFASTSADYVAQVEAATDEDSPALARARRAEAERHSWDHTLDAMRQLLAGQLET